MKIIKFQQKKNYSYLRKVIIKNLILNIFVGLHKFEKKKKQRVRFNIEILTNPHIYPNNKDLTSILNYEEVVKKIEKLTHLKHHELIEDLGAKPPMNVVLWFYVPPVKQYGKGQFKIWWTRKGLYSDITNWKEIKGLSQWDAWTYFDRMLEKGFVPYEGSIVPKLKLKLCGKS